MALGVSPRLKWVVLRVLTALPPFPRIAVLRRPDVVDEAGEDVEGHLQFTRVVGASEETGRNLWRPTWPRLLTQVDPASSSSPQGATGSSGSLSPNASGNRAAANSWLAMASNITDTPESSSWSSGVIGLVISTFNFNGIRVPSVMFL